MNTFIPPDGYQFADNEVSRYFQRVIMRQAVCGFEHGYDDDDARAQVMMAIRFASIDEVWVFVNYLNSIPAYNQNNRGYSPIWDANGTARSTYVKTINKILQHYNLLDKFKDCGAVIWIWLDSSTQRSQFLAYIDGETIAGNAIRLGYRSGPHTQLGKGDNSVSARAKWLYSNECPSKVKKRNKPAQCYFSDIFIPVLTTKQESNELPKSKRRSKA